PLACRDVDLVIIERSKYHHAIVFAATAHAPLLAQLYCIVRHIVAAQACNGNNGYLGRGAVSKTFELALQLGLLAGCEHVRKVIDQSRWRWLVGKVFAGRQRNDLCAHQSKYSHPTK